MVSGRVGSGYGEGAKYKYKYKFHIDTIQSKKKMSQHQCTEMCIYTHNTYYMWLCAHSMTL